MHVRTINGQDYRLPGMLTPFQQALYVHLINWKWQNITREPGTYRGAAYDLFLPERYADQFRTIYPGVVEPLKAHLQKFPFRVHRFFNHMASSQAANANLFLPILIHPRASEVLAALRPDFTRLAASYLDQGYRIEFWDEPFGNLNDKSSIAGTDADIAIAYFNHQGELCLWLIEHKLTEKEFTTCGGFKAKGRLPKHDCSRPFSDIVEQKELCYYHDVNEFSYWNVTEANRAFFPNHAAHAHCPFQGGLNQLWRNQLLALSIEQDERQPYRHVTFSVVKHPGNTQLDRSLAEYRELIAGNPSFSVLTSSDVIAAAAALGDPELDQWISWYRQLYAL